MVWRAIGAIGDAGKFVLGKTIKYTALGAWNTGSYLTRKHPLALVSAVVLGGTATYIVKNPTPGPVSEYTTFTGMYADQEPDEFRPGIARRWTQVHYDLATDGGKCAGPGVRGILVDYNGRVLEQVVKPQDQTLQATIDADRERLFIEGESDIIKAENANNSGYPYYFSCNGNSAALEQRVEWVRDDVVESGTRWEPEGVRLWDNNSLDDLLLLATDDTPGMKVEDANRLAGKAYVEYGTRTSRTGAMGVMQVMNSNFELCNFDSDSDVDNYIGQAFCAVRVLQEAEENIGIFLEGAPEGSPTEFTTELTRNMATLTYNAGIGNVRHIMRSDCFADLHDKRSRWYTPGFGYTDEDLVTAGALCNFGQGPIRGQKIGFDATMYFPRVLAGEQVIADDRNLGEEIWRRITHFVG